MSVPSHRATQAAAKWQVFNIGKIYFGKQEQKT